MHSHYLSLSLSLSLLLSLHRSFSVDVCRYSNVILTGPYDDILACAAQVHGAVNCIAVWVWESLQPEPYQGRVWRRQYWIPTLDSHSPPSRSPLPFFAGPVLLKQQDTDASTGVIPREDSLTATVPHILLSPNYSHFPARRLDLARAACGCCRRAGPTYRRPSPAAYRRTAVQTCRCGVGA